MRSSHEIVIELSKKKIALHIFGAILFLCLGIDLLTVNEADLANSSIFNNPTEAHSWGVIAIILFGSSAVYGIRKLFDKKPGLVLTELGIIDNSTGVSLGLIPWSEITEIRDGTSFIAIYINNPLKYLENGNFFQRRLLRLTTVCFGTPINISSTMLSISADELYNAIKASFDNNRNKCSS